MTPERVLRTALLGLALLGAVAPALAPGGPAPDAGWGLRLVAPALVVLALFVSLGAEARPEALDGYGAQRARRVAPLALGAAAAGAVLFPRVATWGYVWYVFALAAPLAFFWHVPRVRAVSLVLASVAAFAAAVLAPGAAWCLAPVGLAWAAVPPLERAARVRLQVPGRPPAPLGAVALTVGLALGAGGAVFGGVWAALPPLEGAASPVGPPRTGPGPGSTEPIEPPSLLRLLVLLGGVTALAAIGQRLWSGRRGGEADEPPVAAVRAGVDGLAREAAQAAAAAGAWPPGPRRDLVLAYLEHLARLAEQGQGRGEGLTPAAFAAEVGRARPAAAGAAEQLAELFGRARWSPAPVAPDAVARAEASARRVEEG